MPIAEKITDHIFQASCAMNSLIISLRVIDEKQKNKNAMEQLNHCFSTTTLQYSIKKKKYFHILQVKNSLM